MNKKWLPNWLKYIVLFGIEFNVTIYKLVTLRKIAFLVLFYLFLKQWKRGRGLKLSRSYSTLIILFTVLLVYGILLMRINSPSLKIPMNTIYPTNRPIMYLLSILVFPYFLTFIFADMKEFCVFQSNIMLFQAFIGWGGIMNQKFALFIYNNFHYGDKQVLDSLMRGVRVPCIDMGGATASVIMFSGCICCAYLMYCKYNSKYIIKYIIITSSMMFIGRTGLYFSLLLLIVYFGMEARRGSRSAVILLEIALLGVGIILLYVTFAPDSTLKRHFINWVGEIITKGVGKGSTIQALSDMVIPVLTKETFWGMSIVRGTSYLGTTVQHDSGYIMNYASIGVPGIFMLYGGILGFYYSQIKKIPMLNARIFISILLLCCFVFEIKEPFLQKTPLLIILSAMIFICKKDVAKENLKSVSSESEKRILTMGRNT